MGIGCPDSSKKELYCFLLNFYKILGVKLIIEALNVVMSVGLMCATLV